MTVKIVKTLLTAALPSCVSAHADSAISIGLKEGGHIATFKAGDSRGVLKDVQIRCAPKSE